jgi:hypothetical protein
MENATASHAPMQGDLIRDGKRIVTRSGTLFPKFCVICDRPVEGLPLKLRFKRRKRAAAAMVGSAVGGMAGAALIASVEVGSSAHDPFTGTVFAKVFVCPRHRRRIIYVWIAILGLVIVSAGLIAYLSQIAKPKDTGWLLLLIPMFVGIIGIVALPVTGWNPWLSSCKFRNDYVWLKGAGKKFLAGVDSSVINVPTQKPSATSAVVLPPRPKLSGLSKGSRST